MLNTYEQMLDLVKQKLATVSVNDNLSTFKYARRVMFDYLWNTNPLLMECRGHTYDNTTGEIVVAAPSKSFNYLENNWGRELQPDTKVQIAKKYNGFLACVSKHEGEIVVSTTGSTRSEFVAMAKSLLPCSDPDAYECSTTDFYEIIHEDDPHIVYEGDFRAEWLGCRDKSTGEVLAWGSLSDFVTRDEALQIAERDKGEGFMMYAEGDYSKAYKLKTPYYVGKKKLMRMSKNNVDTMYKFPKTVVESLPEMWKYLPEIIIVAFHKEEWAEMNDQERRKFLETIIN